MMISDRFYSSYGEAQLSREQKHKAILVQGIIDNVLHGVQDIDFDALDDIYDIMRKQISSGRSIHEIRQWADKNINVKVLGTIKIKDNK